MNNEVFVVSNGSEAIFVFTDLTEAQDFGKINNCDFVDEIIVDVTKNQIIKTWKYDYEDRVWKEFN